MNQSEFVFWLNGYVEICGARPDDRQWDIIKDHLTLVFNKVTPSRSSPTYCSSTFTPTTWPNRSPDSVC